MLNNYDDIITLGKILKLWVDSIDCIGVECNKCNKHKICNSVCDIFKLIEEIKENEEL